ncbi:MAG: AAA family ATPase [Patescibacteria group bacterium]|nr:AAA family ATPase [Patescibacteria group bacterium]
MSDPVQLPVNDFRALWSRGYRHLIPIIPPHADVAENSHLHKLIGTPNDPRGKAPGTRGRDGKWHFLKGWSTYEASESDLDRWHAMGASIGILAGHESIGIDADAYDSAHAKTIRDAVHEILGHAPERIGQAPKALYMFAPNGVIPYSVLPFGELIDGRRRNRIEVLSLGRQFVVQGPHPKTGKPYFWPVRPEPVENLLMVTNDQIGRLFDRLKVLLPNPGRVETSGGEAPSPESLKEVRPGSVAEALAHIPNTSQRFPTRESYLLMGYAIKGALGDSGFDAYAEWCSRWADGENKAETVASDWGRMKSPYRIGAPWIYDLAAECDPSGYSAADPWFETVAEPESIFGAESGTPAAPRLAATPYAFPPASAIPPREFLYGTHYLREYISTTIAPTKAGKSSLGIVEALAMASGKPLLGVTPTGLYRVRIWNGEDPILEMQRRVFAAIQEYGLTREDLGDRLFLDSGRDMPICIGAQKRDGVTIYAPVISELEKSLEEQKIDAMILDPFIKSHGVSENDNMAVDLVVRELNGVCGRRRVAADLVHHSRKQNGSEATLDDARGASSLVSAARSARVLARMTKREGSGLLNPNDYKRLFRFAEASSNMAISAGDDETWMQIKSVDIHNGIFDANGVCIRSSDKVGVVKTFDLTIAKLEAVREDEAKAPSGAEVAALEAIRANAWRKDTRASNWAGVPVARAFGHDLDTPEGKAATLAVLKKWTSQGKLREVDRKDDGRHVRTYVEVVGFDLFA